MGEEGVSVVTAVAGEEDGAPPVDVAGDVEDEAMVLAAAAEPDPIAAAAAAAAADDASTAGFCSPRLAM